MSRIISIHSFRGGTGKSIMTANIAVLLAAAGQRVAVIDTNLESPSQHLLFNLPENEVLHPLNDYLWGRCSGIRPTLHDVTPRLQANLPGQVMLIPGSTDFSETRRIMLHGYDVGLLNYGCYELIDKLGLDTLIIDTRSGLGAETMASIAITHTLAIMMHLDMQDYKGTSIIVDLARQIDMPHRRLLIANEVPLTFDRDVVKLELEKAFDCPVVAVLPYSTDLMALSSNHIFALHYPDHPLTATLKDLSVKLVA